MERFARTHRLLSSTLVAVLGLGFPGPSFALRPEPVAEKGAGLEELTDQLQTQTPDQRADLILAAKRYVEESFSVGRAVAVAGHGRNARIPKRLQNVADYVESSVAGISPQQEGFPGSDEVRRMDPAAAHAVEWAQRNVRFVVVSDDENGFLAANGVAGTDSHVAVVAYAGWYPYPGWEKGMAPQMVEQIKGGMRALQQGSTLSRERFAGPPTVYLSETQVRSFMEGGDRGNQAFQIKLAHELKDIFNKGKPGVRPPAADVRIVDGYIAQSMQAIQEAKRKRKEAAAQREASKLTKFHVTADLSGLLSAPASAQQRRQITQRVEETLRGFQKDGIIFGFDVHLFNQGKMLVVDLDYREGGDPTQKPAGVAAIQSAVRRGVLEAQTLGLTSPGSETELLSRVVLHSGENRLTQRASEPIVTVQAMGLGMGAFNRVIWHLLVGDVGHLQAVGGERGFRVVVANLSDIREGKKQYRTYEFETPGISEQKIKEIIRKLQANEMTEEDLKDAASRNLHQLHRLIGAMDEYAIEGVYPLAGSRFAAKEGKEPVTLTDEPIIKVHLHENPQGDFRGQSGAWATGSYQKVLTLPHFAPNAEQTRWVGMIPVTLQEAGDLSVLENEGWPVGEMGFMTAWAWSYDRGGTGRGEPPVTDVFGKNNQAQINRRVLQPLMEVWKGLANFEPRLTAEEAARRASAAAGQFLSVEKVSGDVLPTGVWHPIPDLKKREADSVVQRFQGEGKLTWSFFKADIGGKAGHDQVLQTHMAAARAKLAEAKEKGLIEDYKVFFVGDDMQLAILHKNGIQSEKMHALAWQVFSFGYWVSYTINLEPYGHAQDIRIAELFHKFPIEHHAQLSRRAVELLKADFERAAGGQADVPDTLKANAQTALSSALVKWEMLEGSLKKWEMADAAGTVVAEAVAVGNVTGMGIGWGEMPAEEGVELAYDGLDKSGAGGFNTRLASMMADAIAAGDVRPTDIVEMWDVEQHRRIFLRVGEAMEQILDMAAQVNKYNFKRFLDGETWKIKSWLSSEILAQTAHGYVGKDDPILLMLKQVGRHLAETFRDPQRAATAQLGDEAGTHNLANVLRAWWESFPGEKSNPVGASITFRIRDGKIEMEDEGSKPEYDAGRVAAEDFNRMLVGVQGEFSPQVANRRQVEETYPRARMLDEADRNPTAWVDRVDPLSPAAGLEQGIQNLVIAYPLDGNRDFMADLAKSWRPGLNVVGVKTARELTAYLDVADSMPDAIVLDLPSIGIGVLDTVPSNIPVGLLGDGADWVAGFSQNLPSERSVTASLRDEFQVAQVLHGSGRFVAGETNHSVESFPRLLTALDQAVALQTTGLEEDIGAQVRVIIADAAWYPPTAVVDGTRLEDLRLDDTEWDAMMHGLEKGFNFMIPAEHTAWETVGDVVRYIKTRRAIIAGEVFPRVDVVARILAAARDGSASQLQLKGDVSSFSVSADLSLETKEPSLRVKVRAVGGDPDKVRLVIADGIATVESIVPLPTGLEETWDRANLDKWLILKGNGFGLSLVQGLPERAEILDIGNFYWMRDTRSKLPAYMAANILSNPAGHLVAVAPDGQVALIREGELRAAGQDAEAWYNKAAQSVQLRSPPTWQSWQQLVDDHYAAGLEEGEQDSLPDEPLPSLAQDRELAQRVVEGDQVGAPIDLGDEGLALVVPARTLGLRSDFYLHTGLSQPEDLPPGIEVMDLPEDQAGFRNALAREVVFDTDFILLNARHVTDPTGWIPPLLGNPARIRITETESETASVLDLVAAGRWSRLFDGVVNYGSLKITYVTVNDVIYAVIRSA